MPILEYNVVFNVGTESAQRIGDAIDKSVDSSIANLQKKMGSISKSINITIDKNNVEKEIKSISGLIKGIPSAINIKPEFDVSGIVVDVSADTTKLLEQIEAVKSSTHVASFEINLDIQKALENLNAFKNQTFKIEALIGIKTPSDERLDAIKSTIKKKLTPLVEVSIKQPTKEEVKKFVGSGIFAKALNIPVKPSVDAESFTKDILSSITTPISVPTRLAVPTKEDMTEYARLTPTVGLSTSFLIPENFYDFFGDLSTKIEEQKLKARVDVIVNKKALHQSLKNFFDVKFYEIGGLQVDTSGISAALNNFKESDALEFPVRFEKVHPAALEAALPMNYSYEIPVTPLLKEKNIELTLRLKTDMAKKQVLGIKNLAKREIHGMSVYLDIRAYKKSITKLKNQVASLGKDVILDISFDQKALKQISTQISSLSFDNRSFTDFSNQVMDLAQALEMYADVLKEAGSATKQFASEVTTVVREQKKQEEKSRGAAAATKELSGAIKTVDRSAVEAAKGMKRLTQVENEMKESAKNAGSAYYGQLDSFRNLTAELKKLEAEFKNAAASGDLSSSQKKRMKKDVESLSSAIVEERIKLEELAVQAGISTAAETGMFNAIAAGENAIRSASTQIESYEAKRRKANETVDESVRKFLEEHEAFKAGTSALREKIAALDALVASGSATSETLRRSSEEIERMSNELTETSVALRTMGSTTALNNNQLRAMSTSMASFSRAQASASRRIRAVNQALVLQGEAASESKAQVGLMNKQFAGANQMLFSFSDLIQDSAQFQYGFATGMRAIGNNIAFTAELFAVMAANVASHNAQVAAGNIHGAKQINVFDAIKQSLTGAGGVIMGINIAVTAITMLSQAFSKSNSEANKAKDAFKQYASELAQMRMVQEDDVFGIVQMEKELEVLQEQAEKAFEMQKNVADLENQISNLYYMTPSPSTSQVVKDRQKELEEEKRRLDLIAGSYEEFQDQIKETNDELTRSRFYLMSDELGAFIKRINDATTDVLQFGVVNDESEEAFQRQIKAFETMIEEIKSSGEPIEEAGAKIQALESQISRLESGLNDSGDSAKDMDDILKDLLKTITELTKESQELAITTNQYIGELTADAILQSKEYQAEQDRLYALAVGKSQEVVDAINRILTLNQQIFSMKSSQIAREIVDSFDESGDAIQGIKDKYEDAADALLNYNLTVEGGLENYDKLLERLSELEQKELAIARLNIFSEEIAGVVSYYSTMAEAGENNEEQIKRLIKQYKAERANILQNKTVYMDAEQMIADYNAAIASLGGLLDDTTEKAKTFFDILGERSLLVRVFGQEGDIRNFIKALQDQLDNLRAGTSIAVKTSGAVQTMGGASLESAEKIEALEAAIEAFMNMLDNGSGGASKKVEDYSKNIKDLRREVFLLETEINRGADYASAVASTVSYISVIEDLEEELSNLSDEQVQAKADVRELIALRGEEFRLLSQLSVMDISGAFDFGDAKTEAEKLNDEINNAINILNYLKDVRIAFKMDTSDIDALIEKLRNVQFEQGQVEKRQVAVNNLMSAIELINVGSAFAEMFGASKDLQIALATISGLTAIVQVMADPSNPTILGKLAASATIAASVAKQIQQIKDTEIGSSSNIDSSTQVSQPSQYITFGNSDQMVPQPSFTPTVQNSGAPIYVNNQVLVDRRGLAIQTRLGEEEIMSSQKTVSSE